MEKNFRGIFTIGLFLALLGSGQTHLNIFLNLHEVLRLIGELPIHTHTHPQRTHTFYTMGV